MQWLQKGESKMTGLKPIVMPSAKQKVAAELRKAILSRKMKEGGFSDPEQRWTD